MRSVVFVVLALSARTALAQDTTMLASADRATTARLEQIVDRARSHGLPVQQIVAKVRYATLVVHAPAPKVIAAAEAVATRLETARDALAPHPSDNDIAAGADAISVGVTPHALTVVRSASPSKPVAVPIGLLTQFVANGISVGRATTLVTDLIRRGASNEQLVALGNSVDQDIAGGWSTDAALDVRVRGLIPLLAPGASPSATSTLGPVSEPGKPKHP